MSTTHTNLQASDWTGMLESADPAKSMVDISRELALLSDEHRLNAMRPMVQAEYALPDADLRRLISLRLTAWAAMPLEERAALAKTYDTLAGELSATQAMRRVSIVQSVLSGMPREQQSSIREVSAERLVGSSLDSPRSREGQSPRPKSGLLGKLLGKSS